MGNGSPVTSCSGGGLRVRSNSVGVTREWSLAGSVQSHVRAGCRLAGRRACLRGRGRVRLRLPDEPKKVRGGVDDHSLVDRHNGQVAYERAAVSAIAEQANDNRPDRGQSLVQHLRRPRPRGSAGPQGRTWWRSVSGRSVSGRSGGGILGEAAARLQRLWARLRPHEDLRRLAECLVARVASALAPRRIDVDDSIRCAGLCDASSLHRQLRKAQLFGQRRHSQSSPGCRTEKKCWRVD